MTQQMVRSDDGYRQSQETIRDCVCSSCHGELVVKWDAEVNGYGVFCPRNCSGKGVTLRSQIDRDQVRERLERSPQLAQAMVPVRDVPLTTQAIRELDNEKLMARVPDRYGSTIEVSRPLKIQLAQLARIYGLDPLWDLMVYEGRPYVTYDGRLRKLREHPEYRGHKVRPLNKAEKDEWGYEAADLVIQCDVDMGPRGTITDWGIVRASEVSGALEKAKRDNKRSAPVGIHPQQIGIKRAVSRASKQAVGIDLPTIVETGGHVIDVQEVRAGRLPSPVDAETAARRRFWVTARSSPPDGLGLDDADVHRLLGVASLTSYPGGWDQALSDLTERAAGDLLPEFADTDSDEGGMATEIHHDTEPTGIDQQKVVAGPSQQTLGAEAGSPAPEPEMVKSARSPLMHRLAELLDEAAEMDIQVGPYQVQLPAPVVDVETKLQKLAAEIQSVRRQIAGDDEPGAEVMF